MVAPVQDRELLAHAVPENVHDLAPGAFALLGVLQLRMRLPDEVQETGLLQRRQMRGPFLQMLAVGQQ